MATIKKEDTHPTLISIDVQTYLDTRLVDQLNWYDKKSSVAQKKYKRMRKIEFIAAACIPFLSGYLSFSIGGVNGIIQAIVGILGIMVTVTSALISLNKYQEEWVEYRTTAETLKHQKYLFQTKVAPYDGDDDRRFKTLVQNVEHCISKEHSVWTQYINIPDNKNNTA